jgi:two-component system, chemotaxis family, chemotaxis protein CheY
MVKASLRQLPNASFGEAANGLEALERLALAAVDLIILDLNMPDIHGLEVLEFVRGHQAYRSIPVIVLTTRDDDVSRAQALGAGATVYLTKPFDPEALGAKAIQLLTGA